MVLTNWGRIVRRGLGICLLIFAALFLIWSLWPAQKSERLVLLPEISSQILGGGSRLILKASQLRVAWPSRMQVGSTGYISVLLEPIGRSGFKTGLQISGSDQPGVVEARLEIPGISLIPDGAVQQSLDVVGPLEFRWQMRANQNGVYQGAIWLHLIELPTPAGGAEARHLLSVQPIEIRATSLLALDAYTAQVVGIIGGIIGAVLCVDILLSFGRQLIGKSL
jgi:hypothetical protein